jgi:hypothetical protein
VRRSSVYPEKPLSRGKHVRRPGTERWFGNLIHRRRRLTP